MAETDRSAAYIERYRSYLRMLGRIQIRGRMQVKVDLSGVVQQTLLEAHQNRDTLDSLPEERRTAWIRAVFANNLGDEVRRHRALRRDVARERPIAAALEDSASRIDEWLAAEESSPSERAVRREDALRLAAALEQLPEDQRTAVELHHLQGVALAELAEQLDRSKPAVAMLIYRGLKRLRTLMQEIPQ